MRAKPIIKGLSSYIPGLSDIFSEKRTGGTCSATYCYGVWLKHLTLLAENGMHAIPNTVAELGPGDSLGVGIAALLSGVENYFALDVVKYSNIERNLSKLDELIDLFKKRAGRPTKGWPDFDQFLGANLFPSHILTEKALDSALTQERIELIRSALKHIDTKGHRNIINYAVPWSDPKIISKQSVDLIYSHAVLEHVTDLDGIYSALSQWLEPGGFISHQIDFSSHGLAKEWNGHWSCPEWLWKIIIGKRPYLINRQPCSKHISFIEKKGFKTICHLKKYSRTGIKRSQLAPPWQNMCENDLACSGTFIQARKT